MASEHSSPDDSSYEQQHIKRPRLDSAPERPGPAMADGGGAGVCVPVNVHLEAMESDFLYHIGYSGHECKELFSDVKFVVSGGSASRMASFAELVAKEIKHPTIVKGELDISKTDRFAFYKIGPVLSISHGMGVPSITIMLHEILKLLHYAKAKDPIILRMGTSGGIDVEPGTVVVTNKSFNAFLKETHDIVVLGKWVSRSSEMDQELAKEVAGCQEDESFPTVLGGTMCTDDFYEGQARMDGVVCEFSPEEKMSYLQRVKDAGVKNIEMECTALASLCKMTGVKCAVVCVALLNRLKGDQVTISPEDYKQYQLRPQTLIASFIRKRLGIEK